MNQLITFYSIFGGNWVVGRYLLPELSRLGSDYLVTLRFDDVPSEAGSSSLGGSDS